MHIGAVECAAGIYAASDALCGPGIDEEGYGDACGMAVPDGL